MSLGPTLRMARHLRPAQVGHRLWRRVRRPWFESSIYDRWVLGSPVVARPNRFPQSLSPGDPANGAGIVAGQIRLIGLDRRLGAPVDWRAAEMPLLWRFTLHYFDWLADLAALPGRAGQEPARALVGDWIDRHDRVEAVAWHPYPLSLRLWNWLVHAAWLLDGAPADFEARFLRSLVRQAHHLGRVREDDVGGNHLIKNLKALTAAAVCLEAPPVPRDDLLADLARQVDRQVPADGMHYERSPDYHLQVLGDLIDLRALLAAAGRFEPWLDGAVVRMGRALATLRHDDGGLALFNDGTVGDPGMLAAVDARLDPQEAPDSLPDAGYQRLAAGETVVLLDAGLCCPGDLPAHAHADTLSFEMSSRGRRLIVNGGTFAYQNPRWRNRLRGTAAHSTVTVDDTDSAEVFGVFRLGRRPRDVTARRDGLQVVARHDGYRHLGIVHQRALSLSLDGGVLAGEDRLDGRTEGRRMTARFHLHPDVAARLDAAAGRVALVLGDERWTFVAESGGIALADSVHAPRFHRLMASRQIVLTARPEDGFRLAWSLRRAAP